MNVKNTRFHHQFEMVDGIPMIVLRSPTTKYEVLACEFYQFLHMRGYIVETHDPPFDLDAYEPVDERHYAELKVDEPIIEV